MRIHHTNGRRGFCTEVVAGALAAQRARDVTKALKTRWRLDFLKLQSNGTEQKMAVRLPTMYHLVRKKKLGGNVTNTQVMYGKHR
jgi:hypothetical protein